MKERFKTFLQAFPEILGEFWSAYFTIDHVQLNFLLIESPVASVTKKVVQKLWKVYTKIIQNTKFVYILYIKVVPIKILYDNKCTGNAN